MTRSLSAIGLAAMLGASAAAWAQQAAPVPVAPHEVKRTETAARPVPAYIQVGDRDVIVHPYGLTVGQFEGAALFGTDGDEIGRIGGVMVTPQGRAAAVSVEVGSVLGAGRKEVIVPLDSVSLQGTHLVASMTRHEVEALPAWSR